MRERGLESAIRLPDLNPGVSGWTYALARRAGADHASCDDACVCEVLGETILAAVADGAGSAEQAHRGAAIACDTFIELALQIYSGAIEPTCLIAAIQARIPEKEREAHSATLLGVVADDKGALVVQVGDGAAVFRTTSQEPTIDYEVALWPEETEFLNHTFFVTAPDAEEHLRVRRLNQPVDEFALFTDGLQLLIIDPKSKEPHRPFFDSIFKSLTSPSGPNDAASAWLESVLGSDPVTKRTDDDTSIVIARRSSGGAEC